MGYLKTVIAAWRDSTVIEMNLKDIKFKSECYFVLEHFRNSDPGLCSGTISSRVLPTLSETMAIQPVLSLSSSLGYGFARAQR